MQILIAEDDETSRLLLETTLSRWGHEVVSTKDGQQAYDALLEKDGPKLAILDWMMPYLDGVEICRKARLESAIQHLYIVMLTTRNTVDDITEKHRVPKHVPENHSIAVRQKEIGCEASHGLAC